jgi:demethylmenaquinone methyltransferase/2-methoxy-6-polyprenyl-1,4-benzoquinol methylase
VSVSARAKLLFAPLAPSYERAATVLSFGQDARWRAYLVERFAEAPGGRVLDVATGTGSVARELLRAGFVVVGLDQSPQMLAEARRRLGETVELVEASADALPFADESFDALSFTYLLRYVEDPAATLRELARVVRPGGVIAGLEFGLPERIWRIPWELHVRVGFRLAAPALGPGWREVAGFLGGSIRDFNRCWPPERLDGAWAEAGVEDVQRHTMSLGGGTVTWGHKRRGQPSMR